MSQAGIIRFKYKQSLLSLLIHYFYETQPQNEFKSGLSFTHLAGAEYYNQTLHHPHKSFLFKLFA